MAEKEITPRGRVSFPDLFEATKFEGGELRYRVTLLFPKDTDLTKLRNLANAAVLKKWPDKSTRPKLSGPFLDGDEYTYAGFPGHTFIRLTSKQRPGVVDVNRERINPEDESMYAGCYAHASVNAFTFNKAGNAGVRFGLNNIQKLAEGEPFTGRSTPEEDFEPVAGAGAPAGGDDMFGDEPSRDSSYDESDDILF